MPPLPLDPSRLNGWKEIATHLGKGVRTVQRWEKLYGLPIHRLGDTGEIVYAFRGEIDEWLRRVDRGNTLSSREEASAQAAEQASPDRAAPPPIPRVPPIPAAPPVPLAPPATPTSRSPAPPDLDARRAAARRGTLLALVSLAALATLAGAWAWWSRSPRNVPAERREPVSWRIDDQDFVALGADESELWRYPLGIASREEFDTAREPQWSSPVAIADLDNDGLNEVLVMVSAAIKRTDRALFCLNADGTLRWRYQPQDTQRYGDTLYTSPWLSWKFLVHRNPDGTRSVWAVSVHGFEFPTVLERLDPQGNVLSRYWSNGYINVVNEVVWQGRRVLLVGAANNEHKGASLAVLDGENPSGRAPAANRGYLCTTCPGGDPLAFIVFPTTPMGALQGETSGVVEAWIHGTDEIIAGVKDLHSPLLMEGVVHFTLDGELRLREVEPAASYRRLHDRLFALGWIDRPFTPAETQRMVPLLRWDGSRFVEVPLAGAAAAER